MNHIKCVGINGALSSPLTRGAIFLLLMLICPRMQGADWYLEQTGVVNKGNDPFFAGMNGSYYDVLDGYHSFTWPRTDQNEEVAVKCSAPPKIIKQDDIVTLNINIVKYQNSHTDPLPQVGFGFNTDLDGNPNAPYDEVFIFGRSQKEGNKATLEFDYPMLQDVHDLGSNAPEGAEFAIVFSTEYGETRWIYKYHYGDYVPPKGTNQEGEAGEKAEGDGSAIAPEDDNPEDDDDAAERAWKTGLGSTLGIGLLTILGALGGAGEEEERTSKGTRPSDRYVTVLPDGTIEYTNPITYEVDYLPPGSDEGAIRDQVEHVLDNRSYYERIQNQHDRWTAEQRAQQQRELAERRKEWEARLREQEAQKEALRKQQEAEEARKRERLERLMEEHGAGGEEFLRRNMIRDMGWDESRYWDHMSHSDGIDSAMHAVGFTKNTADVGMDVAAAVGGEKGEAIRDAYKVATEMAGTLADAHARGESLTDAAVLGLKRSAITLAEYHTTGKIHTATVIVGESARDIVTAYKEGKSGWEIFKAGLKGAGRGTKDAIVDHFTNKWSKIGQNSVNNNTGVGKTLSNAYDSKTAENVMKQAEAAGDDLGKIWGDKYFE